MKGRTTAENFEKEMLLKGARGAKLHEDFRLAATSSEKISGLLIDNARNARNTRLLKLKSRTMTQQDTSCHILYLAGLDL